MDNPILSICIPTYNRATYLNDTINSIVNQKRFRETDDVEIIISDNFSEDNTREVCEKYMGLYGDKIRYYRNSENIKDANFEKVLSYGRGDFLKLNNDTLFHHNDSLDIIISIIKQNISKKDIIFFSNGSIRNIKEYHCKDLDSFVKTVSYWSTWIACFGIWKNDFETIDGFSKNSNLKLVQTDVLLRLISSGRSAYINNSKIFDPVNLQSKGGYNVYKVFVSNYLWLLEEYRKNKQISWLTLFNEKTRLFVNFITPWTLKLLSNKTNYYFDRKGAGKIIFKEYSKHPILYLGFIYLIVRWLLDSVRFKNKYSS